MKKRNNHYETRKAIYRLKRSHGDYILVQQRTQTAKLNFKAGTKQTSIRHIPVYRAIVLNQDILRKFAYDLAYIAANKNFTYGGEYDQYDRFFIIDGSDLPKGVDIDQTFRIIWEAMPYRIEKVAKTDDDGKSYMCACKTLLSEDLFAHASSIINLCGSTEPTSEIPSGSGFGDGFGGGFG